MSEALAPAIPAKSSRTTCGHQSMVHRHHRYAGHLHGAPRHRHRQRRASPHRRRPRRQRRRKHLGPHQLSRLQRRSAAALRVAQPPLRAQALLHDLRRALHRQLAALRICAQPRHADLFSRPARNRRRRPSSGRAGHPGRYFPCRPNAPPPSLFTAWPSSPPRPSVRRSAAGSPTIGAGAGFSSSTFPSASSP